MNTKAPNRARRTILLALVGVALVVGVGVRFWPVTLPKKSAPIEARVELAAGSVSVERDGETALAVSGLALRSDSTVRVAPSARAMLRLPDGSGAFLRGGTELLVDGAFASLQQGEYWVDASAAGREPFEHRIGDVRVNASDCGLSIQRENSVTVYVARGMATVTSDGGRVEVQAGERAIVENGKPRVEPVAFWDDWTGGMADYAPGGADGAGRGSLFGVDAQATNGAPATELDIQKQSVHVVMRDGVSETKVDQTFFNPGERDVEGWYWFSVPQGASVSGFAVETDGNLVDGEFIEQREASKKYGVAKASGHSPAILEYVDGRSYRARIFPVEALKTRRVVLRYLQLQPVVSGKLNYVYPMSLGKPNKIGEFSLKVDLGEAGKSMQIATLADARVENNGEFVTMRRSGFTPRVDFQLEARVKSAQSPVRVSRFAGPQDSADYLLVRYSPDVDWQKAAPTSADVVVVVDTSAAGDEATRTLKTQTAEAILRSLSEDDHFALIALDVAARVLHPAENLAAATEENVSKALALLAEHSSGGATDLSALFDVGLARLHQSKQPAVVYVGDGIATSGELTPEQLLSRLKRAFATSSARLFSVGVGSEADHGLLSELSRTAGGQSFRVDEGAETTVRALQLSAAVKLPTLTEVSIDLGAGLDQVFVSGGARVAQGSEVSVLARSHHDLPSRVKVTGKLAGAPFEKTYDITNDAGVLAAFVPRLWATEYVRSILGAAEDPDKERGRISALGVEYGLLTPYSSILALESEAAYSRMGIQRRARQLRGTRLTSLSRDEETRLRTQFAAMWLAAPPMAMGCQSEGAPASQEMAPTEGLDETERAAQSMMAEREEEAPMGARALPEEKAKGAGRAEAIAFIDEVAPAAEFSDEAAPVAEPPAAPPPEPESRAMPVRRLAPRASGGLGTGFSGKPGQQSGDLDDARVLPKKVAQIASGPVDAEVLRKVPTRRSLIDVALGTCSDASARPLWLRSLLWQKRLKTAENGQELLDRYTAARRACELPDWRAERTFLQLLSRRITNAGDAQMLLQSFAWRKDVQLYIGRLLLRRSVDPVLVRAVERELFDGAVNWNQVDIALSQITALEGRIEKLRAFMDMAPDDPNGTVRLIELLVRSDKLPDAVALGRKLRERGLLTPDTARKLGDLLAQAGEKEAALRAYSEIVEFDPAGVLSRRLLGDVYLTHGWYDPAYRQFRTITDRNANEPLDWLRLATAAAGAGRTDEALRIEHRIASAQGNPGPDDPRRWARLLSATRLSTLWMRPQNDASPKRSSLSRKLQELQLFPSPGVLVILAWEDLSRALRIDTNEKPRGDSEATDASAVGLYSRSFSLTDPAKAGLVAYLATPPENRALGLIRHDISWDGKEFVIQRSVHQLAAGGVSVQL